MEIERKWLVKTWPKNLECVKTHHMEQGYISTKPTVRIRKEQELGNKTDYVLCFKAGFGLTREEIELNISASEFADLRDKILGKALIIKTRKDYILPCGNRLEVNEVDKGTKSEFYYAEIEFENEQTAKAWQAPTAELAEFLQMEVTYEKGQSMADYWRETRE